MIDILQESVLDRAIVGPLMSDRMIVGPAWGCRAPKREGDLQLAYHYIEPAPCDHTAEQRRAADPASSTCDVQRKRTEGNVKRLVGRDWARLSARKID